ncbi:hypothetical protein [Halopiger djelfimassiliensis]|uniref:hypothetical protein n=1 Tax=Halopiger djelfimassiliensis TaxID=1293047 RepID=UPI000677956E|nr:hypothetical protein [Halopiger djelfimassiliensis]
MGDPSDEVTESRDAEPASTDELLEETDRLLSDSGSGVGESGGEPLTGPRPHERDGTSPAADSVDGAAGESGSLRHSGLADRLSLERYFSPKAFLALVLVVGLGLIAGDTVVPIGGRAVGTFLVAFLAGLIASRRRYLEMTAAGASVGAAAAVFDHAVIAVAGSGSAVLAVGAAVGLVSSVGGYYFGRDLRDGLSRDVE